MSDEQPSRNPIPSMIIVLLLVGGGWYFFHHYQISGLDKVSVAEKLQGESLTEYVSFHGDGADSTAMTNGDSDGNPFAFARNRVANTAAKEPVGDLRPLRIATWSLQGFLTEQLANDATQENLVRVVRQFDLIALQQVTTKQRDLLPRMLRAINAGDPRYDYVIGKPTGPPDQSTTLAFIFDKARLQVDRSQTYSVADPENLMTFDPLVAWFRALGPSPDAAWTFSMVNIQIDLAKAREEVSLISSIMASVRFDGRGEDDVVLAGLFQADDAYLLPTVGGNELQLAVRDASTDVLGEHQISNLLVDHEATSEFVGRGGVFDFLRVFNLGLDEATAVSSQLPVYAEFSVREGQPF